MFNQQRKGEIRMKKIKSNESGRSMVEMLGVLAIIGVLSVAGIAGYTTAMNSHRANEAINRVMRLAILVSSQKMLGQTASLSSEDADVTLTEDTANAKFTLKISGLSDAVKAKIQGMDVATATLGTDAQGNLTFTFSNDLSNRSSGSGTDENQDGEEEQEESQEEKLYEGLSSSWTVLNAKSEAQRCPNGGKWASLDDLTQFGCGGNYSTCTEWPAGVGYGWTKTSINSSQAYLIWYDGMSKSYRVGPYSYGTSAPALCVREVSSP